MSYEGENRRVEAPESIHLDKRLTWGHIVSTIVLVLLLLNNYTTGLKYQQAQDKRISILETELSGEHEQLLQVRTSVESRLNSIDRKLDRLIERMIDGAKK